MNDEKCGQASVSRQAFAFCRYTLTVMLWAAVLLKMKPLVVAVWVILVLSAILGIRRAPMIVLYNSTVGRFIPSTEVELSVSGMRFAHTLGSVLGFFCLLYLYFLGERTGWILAVVYAVIKTISAVNLCPAYKLYVCMTSGSCCAFLKKRG